MKQKDPERNDPSAETEQRAGEDFLQRWSRRKAHAREDALQPATATDPAEQPPAPDPQSEAPPLTDADMPPVDSLTENSDVSGFFSPGVSDKLRRIALRKVFSLAIYNVRDGLDDYDEDFTVFEPLGDTITADMRHRQEREAQKQRERAALDQQQAESEIEETIDDEAEQPADRDAQNPGEAQEAAQHQSDEDLAADEDAKRHDA
ncbi:MAG: DUF3306 domain-containing protein [Gammaproteobacteria bacterium]|nr:DUF3306 domain-containing protein [Gammaproteobacteria bacterium]